MDIHEYQAKQILASFGVSIPRGGIVYSPETAEKKAREKAESVRRWRKLHRKSTVIHPRPTHPTDRPHRYSKESKQK